MRTLIPINKIEENKGQIPGLQTNPRKISKEKLSALVKSLKDDPEMLDIREIIVYPFDNKYIAIGGGIEGGMTDTYIDRGTYVKSFYSVMHCPSFVKIGRMGNKYKRLHHHIKWDSAVPKILKEEIKNGTK